MHLVVIQIRLVKMYLFHCSYETSLNFVKITVFGQSAGGQSAALHYVTEDMQSYFRAVIVESAPTTIPFRYFL